MYLSNVVVENFKSFRGTTIIPFECGFTAITGPNGSGKSNCGDAIQFVLGPRSSKSLRAGSVSDLIFNGGGTHRPATHCSVSLIFANPVLADGKRRLPLDQDEIKFTRSVKIGRKGQATSSYHLDGRVSSLGEFRRLLASSGIRADGYNIVLQGDVTALANMGSVPRRRVLEEIAGVTAYDQEITKANRQKNKAEASITHLELLHHDQCQRRDDLKSERELALKHKKLHDDLADARITHLWARHRAKFEEIELTLEQVEIQRQRSEFEKESVDQGHKDRLKLDENLAQIERSLEEILGPDHKTLTSSINNLRVRIDRAKDRIDEAEEASLRDVAEMERLESDKEGIVEEIAEVRNSADEAEAAAVNAAAALKKALDDEQSARDAVDAGDRRSHELLRTLAQANEAVGLAEENVGKARAEYERAQARLESVEAALGEAEERLEDLRLDVDDVKHRLEEIGGDTPAVDKKALLSRLQQLQEEDRSLCAQRDDLDARARKARRDLDESQRAATKRGDDLGGQSPAVRAILQLRDAGDVRGIHGTLGELAAPRDPLHEEALALALGGRLNSIVVEDDEVAASCIKWLRSARIGRATFLPLSKLSPLRDGGRAQLVSRKDGVVGFAWSLLDIEERFSVALRHAVRDTLVVESTSVGRTHMGGVRMVSLDGSVFEPGGAMSGGKGPKSQRASFGGDARRKHAVDEFRSEVTRLEMALDAISSAVDENRASQRKVRGDIQTASAADLNDEVQELRMRADLLEKDRPKVNAAVAARKSELEKATAGVEAALVSIDEAELEVGQCIEEREASSKEVHEQTPEHLATRLRAAEEARLASREAGAEADAAKLNAEGRITLLESAKSDIQRRMDRLISDSETREKLVAEENSERSEAASELEGLERQQSEISEEADALSASRLEAVERRARIEQNIRSAEDRMRRHDESRMALEQRILAQRSELSELDSEIEDGEIGTPPAGLDLPSVESARDRERRLSRQLEQLGPVNMLAIEQYESTLERLAAFESDLKILAQERDHLDGLTERLEDERKARLQAVLEAIDKNFQEIYQRLDSGGEAHLELENPDDPFNAGLAMVARPAGKSKVTRLESLSGGEKSMVALAFVFAVQQFDPSPFYYLDEVDQNLDAANAQRIAELCREVSSHAQFIMVSLRKVSLQLADHHLGVTHPGDGVSQIITDLDADRAVEIGEAALKEQVDGAKSQRSKVIEGLPDPTNMERVPEPHVVLSILESDSVGPDQIPESMSHLVKRSVTNPVDDPSIGGLLSRAVDGVGSEEPAGGELIEKDAASVPSIDGDGAQ